MWVWYIWYNAPPLASRRSRRLCQSLSPHLVVSEQQQQRTCVMRLAQGPCVAPWARAIAARMCVMSSPPARLGSARSSHIYAALVSNAIPRTSAQRRKTHVNIVTALFGTVRTRFTDRPR